MEVVVVTKTSNFEIHGGAIQAQVTLGHVKSETLSALKESHEEHYQALKTLRAELLRRGVSIREYDRNVLWQLTPETGAVFAVGGDGTLLAASHRMDDKVPLIGIRSSSSSVGYLCAGDQAHIAALVDHVMSGTLPVLERARLQAWVYDTRAQMKRLTVPVLNDFLYTNSNPCATTRYELQLGEAQEVHRSSGIWFATATGSTGGIGAAGGKKESPEEKRFQYFVRELYRQEGAKFQLTHGFFDPDRQGMRVENLCDNAVLALDGQRELIPLAYGDHFELLRAKPVLVASLL